MVGSASRVAAQFVRRSVNLKERLWRSSTVRLCIYCMLGAWALLGDPFTLSTASDRALNHEYHNLHVRLSGVDTPPVTVLLLDAESIQGLHNSGQGWMSSDDWPLDYNDHRRLITDLAARLSDPPAALFYDVFFEAPRTASGDLTRLGRTVERLDASGRGAPIVLAGGGVTMPMTEEAHRQLGEPTLSPTAWEGFGDFYPLAAPLTDASSKAGAALPLAPSPTPAVSLYEHWCGAMPRSCDWLTPATAPPMAVNWAIKESPSCVPADYGRRASVVMRRFSEGIMQGMFGRIEPDPVATDCLPMHVLNAARFYAADAPTTLRPPGLAPDIPYVVMVGVKMPSLHDYVQTPVYDRLPGVFLHAFAFENLWRLDADYYWLKDLTYYGLLAWCLCVICFMWQAKRLGRRGHLPRRLYHVLFWWLVIGFSVLAIQLVFHNAMRIVPEGWLSLIALLPLLREVVLRLEANAMQQLMQQGETE